MSVQLDTAPALDETELVRSLRAALRGEVLDRAHPGYDQARRVWNGLIDRRPAAIARCASTADVVAAVGVARAHRPEVSIRGGGHQIAGSAVCDDGLVIDLSPMKGIHVDPAARTVRAQAGVTWGELDRVTQLFGLATTGGEVTTTGIAGFTLGGGMGLIMRQHGLACDNLRSLEIVTADGRIRTASPAEHPDLYWAARGGGRGLGVVTSFEFALHALGPDVAVVQAFYAYDDAARIFPEWAALAPTMPDSVTPQFILWSVPPDPSIPAEFHGQKVVAVIGVHAGSAEEGKAVLEPLRSLGTPLFEVSGSLPYVAIQASVDELFPAGGRYYMKSHFMDAFTEDAIATALEWDARRPTPASLIAIRTMGGAVGRVEADATAYPHRSAGFNFSIDAGWFDPALDDVALDWARGMWDAMRPFANGGVYVNFSGFDDEAADLHGAVFGSSAARLSAIRAEYDPDGLFAAAAHRP